MVMLLEHQLSPLPLHKMTSIQIQFNKNILSNIFSLTWKHEALYLTS